MKKLRALVLFLACALLLGSVSLAAGNLLRVEGPAVVYDGQTGEFSLENAPGGDLFPNFKNLMPGDERAQDVTLVTKNIERPVALYLTSTPDEATKEALEPITVAVSRNGEPVGEFAHSVRENIPLGIFQADGTTVLHVALTVPITVGNEVQDAQSALKWDFTAQPDDVITITPASISSYVGGVSFTDEDDGNSEHVNKSGAPTLRFQVQLPDGVIWDDENGKPIEMTLHREGQPDIKMTPKKVEGSENYYCFPTLERGLEFVDGEKVVKGDYLTLTDVFDADSGSRDGSYTVGLVNDPAWYITAKGTVSGRTYTVQVLPGAAKVYVRYVRDEVNMLDHPSSAITKVVSDPAKVNTIVDAGAEGIYRKAVAVIPAEAVYFTNGKESGLGSFTLNDDDAISGLKPLVALLFDDTVSLTDTLTDDAIEEKMIEHAGHAKSAGAEENYSFDGWKYNFRYLDLVNYNDGNAWVATASPITIYWPYPEETLSDPGAYDYQILHYRKMSRSYAHKALSDIDAWEAELLHNGEKGPVRIVKEDLQYHEKEKGISFTLEYVDGTGDNFSPFVLMWRKKASTPPIRPDRPTPTPTPTETPTGTPTDGPAPSGDVTGTPAPTGPDGNQSGPPSGTPGTGAPGETSQPTTPPTAAPSAPGGPGSSDGAGGPGGSGDGSGDAGSPGGGTGTGGNPSGATLPQTGQTWWPVGLMAAAGIVLLALGLRMGKAGKGKHEA